MTTLTEMGKGARKSAGTLAVAPAGVKNEALSRIARALTARQETILAANGEDLRLAEENGVTKAMQDRLRLTAERLQSMAEAVMYVASLDDPVGKVLGGQTRPNGLEIKQVSVPLGVVGMIFEARPNVTVDCAALCLKSGNACILRGGKEAIHSNTALVQVMRDAVEGCVPVDAIQLVEDTGRETATAMMKMVGYIDVLIPRGGAGLIRSVVENASVPVIETGAGNCHIFVDASADVEMAVNIVDNAKTTRPSVCNALETLLVHKDIAPKLFPLLKERLDQSGVEWRGCPATREIMGTGITAATEEDWKAEFNDYILAVKVVEDIWEALEHIDAYSTHHSEAIVTRDYENSRVFTSRVDSAAVYVNASIRYTDGGEFGLGAEIGISTQKLHARGPMGLAHLTSTKYIVFGNGQIR